MKFLFRKYPAKRGEVIEVRPTAPTVVKFMTAKEFKNYAGGRTHTYFKGQQTEDLVQFTLPFDSTWHAVVEKLDEGIQATSKLTAPPPSLESWVEAPETEMGTEALEQEEEQEQLGTDSPEEEIQ